MENRKVVYRPGPTAPQGGPQQLFATPMVNRKLAIATPEFLARVRAYVLELESRDKGVTVSNSGGWHSTADLFDTKDETMLQLAGELLSAAAEMSYFQIRDSYPDCVVDVTFHGGSWANISRQGDSNKPHTHPGVVWSGVFYVDLGIRDPEPADNGCIEFMDPRQGNIYGAKYLVLPEAGHVLIFPSWLCHYVNPFRGRGERISIAFNTNAKISPLGKA